MLILKTINNELMKGEDVFVWLLNFFSQVLDFFLLLFFVLHTFYKVRRAEHSHTKNHLIFNKQTIQNKQLLFLHIYF